MKREYLKIVRKRNFRTYLDLIERYGLCQGLSGVTVWSLRYRRLQFCIDSIKEYLVSTLDLRCKEL